MDEEDLTSAERRLIEAAGRGEPLDLRSGNPEADDPEQGAAWDETRTIAAETIARLVTTPATRPDAGRPLVLSGARVTGALDVAGMTVVRALTLSHCHLEERAQLSEAELVSLRLPGSFLARGMEAVGCSARGTVSLADGFAAQSPVVLLGASIGGDLYCSSGRFRDEETAFAFVADGARIGGSLIANDIDVQGQFRIPGAHVGGQCILRGASFRNAGQTAFMGDSLVVELGMFCKDGFEVEGEMRLNRSDIRGHLTFDGARLINPQGYALNGHGLKVGEGLNFRYGFASQGMLSLIGASVGAELSTVGAKFSAGETGFALDLEMAEVKGHLALGLAEKVEGTIDLRNTVVRYLDDDATAWSGDYELRGLQYETLPSKPRQRQRRLWVGKDPDVEARLRWLAGNRSGYFPQLYDQLAAAYRAAGDDAGERRVLVVKQRRRRRQLSPVPRAWSFVEDLLVGYGYQTWRSLVPFIALLVLGTVLFGGWYDDGLIDEKTRSGTTTTPPFRPFIYTLDLLLPVVNFTQRENWIASGSAQVWATGFIIAGWVLTTAIVAGLTGLVRRNK